MREHWDAGCRDTQRTLHHKEWLRVGQADGGVVVHDVHHSEQG